MKVIRKSKIEFNPSMITYIFSSYFSLFYITKCDQRLGYLKELNIKYNRRKEIELINESNR
jgi:hypothetical protein